MKKAAALLIVIAALCLPALAVPYTSIESKCEISTSNVSHFSTVTIRIWNIGGIATSCVVKAGGQKRVTGVSINGVADVTFDALTSYKGYTVTCSVN